MDDIKIIFYLVVTLLWFFFNNYRKIQKQARERKKNQPEKEPTAEPETPEFDWEQVFGEGRHTTEAPDFETETIKEASQRPRTFRSGEASRKLPERKQLDLPVSLNEGAESKPTKRTNFKRSLRKRVSNSNRSKKIRRSNWKKAVVLSEVLHPPYV